MEYGATWFFMNELESEKVNTFDFGRMYRMGF